MSPHEAWFGVRPKLSHLRRFGSLIFAKISEDHIPNIQNADDRSIKCRLLGYIGTCIYCIFDTVINQVIITRNVRFHEEEFFLPSVFMYILHSEIAFHTPFDDVLDDEDRDIAIPQYPPRPEYRLAPPTSAAPPHSPLPILSPNSLLFLAFNQHLTAPMIPILMIPIPIPIPMKSPISLMINNLSLGPMLPSLLHPLYINLAARGRKHKRR